MAKVIKAPEALELVGPSVFLAGSIDMGKAVNWQQEITNALMEMPVTILNPRRDDWDSSWEQKIENAQFNEQVTWELDSMDKADIIAMYFAPESQAPITLLELGLMTKDPVKLIVCCPEGFWRKGNVDIVCKRHNVLQVDNLQELIATVKQAFELTGARA